MSGNVVTLLLHALVAMLLTVVAPLLLAAADAMSCVAMDMGNDVMEADGDGDGDGDAG